GRFSNQSHTVMGTDGTIELKFLPRKIRNDTKTRQWVSPDAVRAEHREQEVAAEAYHYRAGLPIPARHVRTHG
ncbi:hypothetical protein, partial [Gimesia maris]|uniref:hypothetical protein n=1 Tax=Gimesia maris TaxID=122 RepID=UPI0030D7D6C2